MNDESSLPILPSGLNLPAPTHGEVPLLCLAIKPERCWVLYVHGESPQVGAHRAQELTNRWGRVTRTWPHVVS